LTQPYLHIAKAVVLRVATHQTNLGKSRNNNGDGTVATVCAKNELIHSLDLAQKQTTNWTE